MPIGGEPREPLELTPRVAAAESVRRWAGWVFRAFGAAALLLGASWWSARPNWAGKSYCEIHHEGFCDGMGFEEYAPTILWTITVVATAVVSALAILTAPVISVNAPCGR